MSRKRPSGSPTAWKERRKAYRKQSGPVSNPGQPSPCNRETRRAPKRREWWQRSAELRADITDYTD